MRILAYQGERGGGGGGGHKQTKTCASSKAHAIMCLYPSFSLCSSRWLKEIMNKKPGILAEKYKRV